MRLLHLKVYEALPLNWVSTHLHHCQGFWRLGLELDDWIVTMAWEVCSLLCWLPASFRHCKGCLNTINGTAGSGSRTLERHVNRGFQVSPPRELPLSARTVTRRKPSSLKGLSPSAASVENSEAAMAGPVSQGLAQTLKSRGPCRQCDMDLRDERELTLDRLKHICLAGHFSIKDSRYCDVLFKPGTQL